jgi:peptide deformylase
MVREILIWPDPTLKKSATAVTKFDETIRTLVADMFETMYAADGVGLAAPQVGVLKNIIVLDTRPRQPESRPVAMINPEILTKEGSTLYVEGCLSLPGEAEEVERATKVRVRFHDVEGKVHEEDCDGLLAIAVQHETDHLHGTVFVDHISALKRELIRKRMKRLKADKDAKRGDSSHSESRSAAPASATRSPPAPPPGLARERRSSGTARSPRSARRPVRARRMSASRAR